ncbi:Peptidase A1 domain-containing protein [Aphelenchoides besseyi]|nr:Peptidase A1 domain-containing protein [Aphelenchoides besseyi]
MKTIVVCLLLCSSTIAFFIPQQHDGLSMLTGKQHRRNAAELREYHKQKRGQHSHSKNYLYGYPDEALIAVIHTGDPKQKTQRAFNVSLETATDWLWLTDSSYKQPDCTNPTAQISGTKLNQTFKGQYENYVVTGEKYSDKLSFISLTGVRSLVDQTFGVVTDITTTADVTTDLNFDGVLGFGWKPKSKAESQNCITPIENLLSTIQSESQYYILHLDGSNKNTSDRNYEFQITFGSANPHCDTNYGYTYLYYNQLLDNGVMMFHFDGFHFNGQDIVAAGDTAIVDLGLPIISMNFKGYYYIYSTINPTFDYDHGVWTVPCTDAQTLSDWVFKIGGHNYTVPATKYVVDIGLGNRDCAVLFDKTPDDVPFKADWILGNPFLW